MEAAAEMMEEGRPVPMTIRSKCDGSIGGYGGIVSVVMVVCYVFTVVVSVVLF